MKTPWVLLLSAILTVATASQAQPASIVSEQIRADGSPVQITLSPADTYLKTVRLWFVSTGAMTIPLELGLNGPDGIKVKAQYIALGSQDAEALANSSGRWIDMTFKANHKGKELKVHTLRAVRAAIAAASGDNCSGLSEALIQEILEQLSASLGRTVPREELCGTGSSEEPEPTTRAAALQLTGLIHKNTCASNKKSKYLIRVDLDLNGVDAALLQTGYQIEVIPALVEFTGRIAAKIKNGDLNGMYANKWILLAAKAGYGKDRISVVKWNRRGMASTRKVRIGNYGTYRGVYGTRSAIGGLLKGGKATFEVVTDYSAYSMCFKLSRVMQEKNWPGPGGR